MNYPLFILNPQFNSMPSQQKINEVCPKLKEKIISIFRQQGYLTYSCVAEETCKKIINRHCQSVIQQDLKEQLMKDVLEHAQKNRYDQLSPSSVADSFVEAISILNQKIIDAQKTNGHIYDRMTVLRSKSQDLKAYERQNQLTEVQCIKNQIQTIKQEIQQIEYEVHTFKDELKLIFFLFLSTDGRTHSQNYISNDMQSHICQQNIHQKHQSQDSDLVQKEFLSEKSSTLTIIFYFTGGLLATQLTILILQFRLSMLSIQLACLSYFVLLLGYFHHQAVHMLIFSFIGSFLLDLLYSIILLLCITSVDSSFLLCPRQTLSQSVKNLWDIKHIALMFTSWSIKLLLAKKWWKFRNPQTKKSYYFIICGSKICLNKRVVVSMINKRV